MKHKHTRGHGGNSDGQNLLGSIVTWAIGLSIGGFALYEIFTWLQGVFAQITSGLGG